MEPDSSEAGQGGNAANPALSPRPGEDATLGHPASRVVAALATGLREPIVAILLAIAFFTTISGKPVDGILMLIAAVSLAWDAGRRPRGQDGQARPATGAATHGGEVSADSEAGGQAIATRPGTAATTGTTTGTDALTGASTATGTGAPAGPSTAAGTGVLVTGALVIAGAVYAGVVGSFTRYSWPATAGIVALGTVVVLIGWHGPLRHRPARDHLPALGAALWGGLFVVGCLWELTALLRQPTLTVTSHAYPTVSALTDPVLASALGRSAVLAAWLGIGWYLVRR